MSRILITRLSSFGDVAMLVPAVYSIAARYPQDRFVVLTRKAFAPLFENLGFNVAIRIFDPGKHGGPLGLVRLINSLTSSGYSHVADMHDVLRTKVIRSALAIQLKKVASIDKGRADKEKMISGKTLYPALPSMLSRYMDVFEELGFPAEMSFTNFFEFRTRSLYPLRSIVPEEKTGKWIGIAPFAKHKGKTYPLEKMEKVILMLAQNTDYKIFLFGLGEKERSVIRKWIDKSDNIIDISGKLNMESELLLMSYLDVMLTMDSANMHLASLVEVPVVSIWGATHPSLGFYGYKQDLDNAVQIDLECRPCSVYGDVACSQENYACLTRIEETAVIAKIEKVLSNSK